ncbi:MAG TPA: hypothetical protein VHU19_14370 [Pyrinomonadaceae bacterium]|jgi:hypothetical protein|nr:hypothetical protein [Pyrinomonadaceae bacterium]
MTREATADACPKCGSTDIKTWTAIGQCPMAVCRACKHRWTLFVRAWKEKGERNKRAAALSARKVGQ